MTSNRSLRFRFKQCSFEWYFLYKLLWYFDILSAGALRTSINVLASGHDKFWYNISDNSIETNLMTLLYFIVTQSSKKCRENNKVYAIKKTSIIEFYLLLFLNSHDPEQSSQFRWLSKIRKNIRGRWYKFENG